MRVTSNDYGPGLPRSGVWIIGLTVLLLTGCLGTSTSRLTAEKPPTDSVPSTAPTAGSQSEDDANTAIASDDEILDAELTGTDEHYVQPSEVDLEIEQLFSDVESLYIEGVLANREMRWEDAQQAFEDATALLASYDLTSDDDRSDVRERFEGVLQEIAGDYRHTLMSMGRLSSEASVAAFLLRFEDLQSVKEFATAPEETPEIDEPTEIAYDFPVELNDKVENCIVYFQTIAKEPFEKFLRRSGMYIPMMREIISAHGLPLDIVYLPLIESGFNNNAYSYAHASGPWQFISSTGKNYGLSRSWWIDERRDFEKSTHAACKYLKKLYDDFGDWKLALAAYNGGEGRVSRQIRRQGTDDFWKLRLKKQTMNYVPLFMAALMIAKDPKSFGFDVEVEAPLDYDWVVTEKSLELTTISKALDVAHRELEFLNPELLRGATPPNRNAYRLRVPKGKQAQFAAVYDNLEASRQTEWVHHKVRRGETVSIIAGKYHVSERAIVEANKLRSRHFIRVGQSLLVPAPGGAGVPPSSWASRDVGDVDKDGTYWVRRGDTMWELARRFGTTVTAIREANNIGSASDLRAGVRIKIPGAEQWASQSTMSGGYREYTVKRGDTLGKIARRFQVRLADLVKANAPINPRLIRVGEKLRIPNS